MLNKTLKRNHNNQPLKSPLTMMNAKHLKTKNSFYYESLEYHQQEQLEFSAPYENIFNLIFRVKSEIFAKENETFPAFKKITPLASGEFDQGYKFK